MGFRFWALARFVKRFAGLRPTALSCWLTPDLYSVSPGCRPPPHLSPRRETWAKDAPVAGRSCDEAARLRELTTGFAEGASEAPAANWPNPFSHPAGSSSAISPPRNGMKFKGTQRRCVIRRFAADAVDVVFDPSARSCRQVRDGSAACGPCDGSRGFGCGTGCAFSRTRPVLAHPHGFTVRATGHRVASFGDLPLREKSYWVGGSRTIRLTHLAIAKQRGTAGGSPAKRLTRLATANTKGETAGARNA